MYFDLKYDDEKFVGLMICPSEEEDPDLLHSYAQSLNLKNPAITFADIAKAGGMNDMDDDDYTHALNLIKTVSMFFDNKPESNVFHVLAEAINFILSMRKPEEEPYSEQDEETDEEADDEWDLADLAPVIFDDDDDDGSDDS